MQDLWDSFIKLIGQFVSPDWGSLIGLIPLGVAAIVVMWLVWLALRLANAPRARRGPGRVPPRPPAGTHLPGPSWAPLLAAIGAFLLLFGLVARGVTLPIGVAVLVLTLLYWGREAMRDYDRIAAPASGTSALVVASPPPGVHMPGPSFRPILVSVAAAVLFYGLVFGGALLVVGVLMLVISLLGWLVDARAEYRLVEAADRTGHLDALPAPRYPTGTIAAFAILLVIGVAINAGIVPAQKAVGGSEGPSGSPASGAAASAAASAPGGGSPVPSGDITIKAENIAFDVSTITAPAGKPFTIVFVNNDSGTPHNVAIHKGSPTGDVVWQGEIFPGVATRVYNVPALEAGTYGFACTVHPNMNGTLTVQ